MSSQTPIVDAAQKYCRAHLTSETGDPYLAWYGYMSEEAANLEMKLNIVTKALEQIAKSSYWWHDNGESKEFFTPDAHYAQKVLKNL